MIERDVAYTLLTIIQSYAPTGADQDQVSIAYRELVKESSEELTKGMANILADGLNYGNWPWTEPLKE